MNAASFLPLRFLCRVAFAAVLAGGTLQSARAQDAAALTTIHTFDNVPITDFDNPVTLGRDGNFYGTADFGGAYHSGCAYRLTPAGIFTDLYDGSPTVGDGTYNFFSPLVQGSDGNFYGTFSGIYDASFVFRLTPEGDFTLVCNYTGEEATSNCALVQGRDGDLYGVASFGEPYDAGTVFKVDSTGTYTRLHAFTRHDGYEPKTALVQGSDGNFYGTTSSGDTDNDPTGSIFRITPGGDFTNLYTLSESDGFFPACALVEGRDGNFYGATAGDDEHGATIFRISPAGVFETVHTFPAGPPYTSATGLVLGGDGNFYGTTSSGGIYGYDQQREGNGTVFQMTPDGVLTTLYHFTGGSDGRNPTGPLVLGGDGGFYGTTASDDTVDGTLFKLTVSSHPAFFAGQISLGQGFYYLAFSGGNPFGYYAFLDDPRYLYHVDLGFEYVFDAADGHGGVYFYDFASGTFFYTSPSFPFPYLYDFTLNSVLYYFPAPADAGRYNTDGTRFFYDFATGQVITK